MWTVGRNAQDFVFSPKNGFCVNGAWATRSSWAITTLIRMWGDRRNVPFSTCWLQAAGPLSWKHCECPRSGSGSQDQSGNTLQCTCHVWMHVCAHVAIILWTTCTVDTYHMSMPSCLIYYMNNIYSYNIILINTYIFYNIIIYYKINIYLMPIRHEYVMNEHCNVHTQKPQTLTLQSLSHMYKYDHNRVLVILRE